MEYIAPGTFIDLDEITALYLNYNHLYTVSAGTFAGLKKLNKIQLDDNRISSVAAGAFEGAAAARKVWISNNNLVNIAADTFRGLSSVRNIYINGNALSFIEPGSFHGLPMIQYINLSNNERLTSIDKDVFNLTELTSTYRVTVPLGGCKLDCQCDIDWLDEAPFTTWNAYCATPPELSTIELPSLKCVNLMVPI
ncbi:PREDICTED: leucine-rich repeat-containing protein 15-like [Priapulus caudatus]|uniref:Leucine-rich repeat-containing protein 15-like n=1 Tax=Priapulus caudatus TaxID=37621 RepID=A0ABM1EK24_PRICU|nr:PREDICTED: leucine-rich repeat-containing protein 15-like [Priapulus caudatus]